MRHSRVEIVLLSAAVGLYVAILFVNGFYNEFIYTTSPTTFWLVDIITKLLIPIALMALVTLGGQIPLSDIGIRFRDENISGFAMLLLIALVTVVLWSVYSFSVGTWYKYFGGSRPNWHYGIPLSDSGSFRPAASMYMALTASIGEEIFFKGLLFCLLLRIGITSAHWITFAIPSSILFAMVHWENGAAELAGTFMYQYIGCLLYLSIRNLIPFISEHLIVDIYHFW